MAGTYSQIYIQIVFAVEGRQNLLQKEWRQEVFKYMAGIIKNKGQKPIIVNGVEDHAHVFVGLNQRWRYLTWYAISKIIPQISSTVTNGSREDLTGRKAMAPSPTAFHRSNRYTTTSRTRKSTTPGKPSRTNTWISSRSLKSNTT